MIPHTTPRHLRNGISPNLGIVFNYSDVLMFFYLGRVDEILDNIRLIAPFFRITDGAIIGLDWKFYAEADTERREMMANSLWAAGILTTIELNSLSIRPQGESWGNWGPSITGRQHFFSIDSIEFAKEYAAEGASLVEEVDYKRLAEDSKRHGYGTPPRIDTTHFEVVQCIELKYVVIEQPVLV